MLIHIDLGYELNTRSGYCLPTHASVFVRLPLSTPGATFISVSSRIPLHTQLCSELGLNDVHTNHISVPSPNIHDSETRDIVPKSARLPPSTAESNGVQKHRTRKSTSCFRNVLTACACSVTAYTAGADTAGIRRRMHMRQG